MDLKRLEYFVRVAEEGSFSRAAAILHITQPALSRHIRQLEESLETQLLVRTGRGARVTDEGERLLVQGRGILRQVARAREEITSMRSTATGRISIGMPMSIASYLALPLAKKVRERFPDVELTITQGRSANLQDWLSSGRIDMAVLLEVPFTPHVENIPLATQELVLIQPLTEVETAPISLSRIHKIPLVIQSQPNSVRMLVELQLSRLGQKPRVAMEIDNLDTIVELVRDGFGSAIVSKRIVQHRDVARELTMRQIINPGLEVTLHLAVPVRQAPRTQRAVIAAIKEVARAILCPGRLQIDGGAPLQPA